MDQLDQNQIKLNFTRDLIVKILGEDILPKLRKAPRGFYVDLNEIEFLEVQEAFQDEKLNHSIRAIEGEEEMKIRKSSEEDGEGTN